MARLVGALSVALALGIGGAPALHAEHVACAPPRCVEHDVPLPPGVAVADPHVRVLLPDGYATSGCEHPVLYLLHGVGDTWESWTERGGAAALTGALPVIVVMADGGRTPDAGWYSDWASGERQYETYFTSTLVSWTESTFRTSATRLIAGLSMGGFGAMSLAARHPGLYAAAGSVSGILDTAMAYPADGAGFELGNEYLGTPDERVWGSYRDPASEAEWRAHNPADAGNVARLKEAGTRLSLYAGTGVPGGGHDPGPSPGSYLTEQYVWQTNQSFARALDAQGVPYDADLLHPGYHGWPHNDDGLAWTLDRWREAGLLTPTCAASTGTPAPADLLPATT